MISLDLILPRSELLGLTVLLILVMLVTSYHYFAMTKVTVCVQEGFALGLAALGAAFVPEILGTVFLIPTAVKMYYLSEPVIWLQIVLLVVVPTFYGALGKK